MNIFRQLDQSEIPEFRKWARDNYKPGDRINPVWHPVVRSECAAMCMEKLKSDTETQWMANFIVYDEDKAIFIAFNETQSSRLGEGTLDECIDIINEHDPDAVDFEKAEQLEVLRDELMEKLEECFQVVRGTSEESSARSYWYNQIRGICGDNLIMGGSMCTIDDTIQSLRGE